MHIAIYFPSAMLRREPPSIYVHAYEALGSVASLVAPTILLPRNETFRSRVRRFFMPRSPFIFKESGVQATVTPVDGDGTTLINVDSHLGQGVEFVVTRQPRLGKLHMPHLLKELQKTGPDINLSLPTPAGSFFVYRRNCRTR